MGVQCLKVDYKEYLLVLFGENYTREVYGMTSDSCDQLYEDSWILPHIFLEAERSTTYPRNVYKYYERLGSIMHNKMDERHEKDRLKLMNHLFVLYREKRVTDLAEKYAIGYISGYLYSRMRDSKDFQDWFSNSITWILLSSKVKIKTKMRLIKICLKYILKQ